MTPIVLDGFLLVLQRYEAARTSPIAKRQPPEERHILAETRRRAIEETLRTHGSVTVAELEARFGVSSITARRDLAELERRGSVRRTHGGAIMPRDGGKEDSFARRMEVAADAKRRLADEALTLLVPGETVFLDSSTTALFVARRIIEAEVTATILTNSLPILDLLFTEGGRELEVFCVGGALRRLARSFVGPLAVLSVREFFADRAFISVKGVAPNGMLTDADQLETEVKRTMIGQAAQSTVLIDRSKLSSWGSSLIAPISDMASVIADGLSASEVETLREFGVADIRVTEPRSVSSSATPRR